MTTFISNIKSAFDAPAENEKRDSGEIVSLILTIAGFAVVALLAVNWLGTAMLNKTADLGACIEGANQYVNNKANNTKCSENHAAKNSFKKDTGYTGRMTGK